MPTPLIVHRSFKESLTGETLREGTRKGIQQFQIKTNDGEMFDITKGEFELLMANPTLEYKHINDDVEVVTQPATHVNGVWEPVDDNGSVISNTTPNRQRMVKRIAKPWQLTAEKSVNGEQVWAKTGKGKNGPTLIMGVPGDDGTIRRVSAKYVYTGVHPKKGPSRRKLGVGSRPHHLGGGTRKEYGLARKKFLAAETPSQRRTDRKTTENLVYTADEYNPRENDFPGIDEAGWSGRARWNGKQKDYVVGRQRTGRKIDPASYQGQVMAWNRAKRMAKKYGLPEPSKPVRVGPAPAKYIRKADRVAVTPSRSGGVMMSSRSGPVMMMLDKGSAKRTLNDDDDGVPEVFDFFRQKLRRANV